MKQVEKSTLFLSTCYGQIWEVAGSAIPVSQEPCLRSGYRLFQD